MFQPLGFLHLRLSGESLIVHGFGAVIEVTGKGTGLPDTKVRRGV
jgi:hypothetical protein